MSFGDSNTGASSVLDKTIYMTPAGNLAFGTWVYPAKAQVVQSPLKYNDFKWQQVVASVGPTGTRLYVDGAPVASAPAATLGLSRWGYWGLGSDTSAAGYPWTGSNFIGGIADAAVYPSPLTDAQVLKHWTLAGQA